MAKVSHALVRPLAQLVCDGCLDITSFVDELKRNRLIVSSVELSTAPLLDHMSRAVEVKPYIVACIVHEDAPHSEPVCYALQTPQPV